MEIEENSEKAKRKKSKEIEEIIVKEEEVDEVKDIKVEEELISFKEKPWVNLRKKIVEKQNKNVPDPVPDTRTPYQKRTEQPLGPGICPLEINSHILLALQEIDEFYKNKTFATSYMLPLTVNKKVMEHYHSSLKPSFYPSQP